jgi:hypothetical protein
LIAGGFERSLEAELGHEIGWSLSDHRTDFPGGDIRGQWIWVSPIPLGHSPQTVVVSATPTRAGAEYSAEPGANPRGCTSIPTRLSFGVGVSGGERRLPPAAILLLSLLLVHRSPGYEHMFITA